MIQVKHNSYPELIQDRTIAGILVEVGITTGNFELLTIDHQQMFNTYLFSINFTVNGHQLTLKYWTKNRLYIDQIESTSFETKQQAVIALFELAVYTNVELIKKLL